MNETPTVTDTISPREHKRREALAHLNQAALNLSGDFAILIFDSQTVSECEAVLSSLHHAITWLSDRENQALRRADAL